VPLCPPAPAPHCATLPTCTCTALCHSAHLHLHRTVPFCPPALRTQPLHHVADVLPPAVVQHVHCQLGTRVVHVEGGDDCGLNHLRAAGAAVTTCSCSDLVVAKASCCKGWAGSAASGWGMVCSRWGIEQLCSTCTCAHDLSRHQAGCAAWRHWRPAPALASDHMLRAAAG
jgi:hypothetical protein